MKVIGIRESSFETKDGNQIDGMSIYCTYPMSGKGVYSGEACERVYITKKRLYDCGYTPVVGDEIKVMYNRFGKVDSIELAEGA